MSERSGAFFSSRWVERPPGVTELDPSLLPAGFRASGVACGVKPSSPDLGLLVCDSESAISAARFTKSALVSAPVELCLSDSGLDVLRAVVVSSGNANAYNGQSGLDDARRVRDTAAEALGLAPSLVGVAATGVTAEPLPVEKIVSGVGAASERVAADGARDFAQAILTTDRGPKQASLEVDVDGRTVRLSAQAKGAGMIAPHLSSATLLCFVQTDAKLAPGSLEGDLDEILETSFERVTVDAQLSPSDSFFMIASGRSGVDCTGSEVFFKSLTELLRQLAVELIADGEGATRVTRLKVVGAHDDGEAERVARAVADSPLVKTAVAGGDPNWGRVLQAACAEIGLHAHHRERVWPSLRLEDESLCEKAVGVVPPSQTGRLSELMRKDEIEMTLDLHRGDHETEIFFSDLTYDYVKFNSGYTT